MNFKDRVTNAVKAFTTPNKTKNSLSNEAADFLRYGNRNRPLYQDWSQVEMSDQDMYTGYSYAAIKKRANRAAVLGKRFLFTEAADSIMDSAKANDEDVIHPYLKLIQESKEFTQKTFWHDISTYLDLEGIYYLMAVRAIGENADGTTKVGDIQKFVMLNPYTIRRITRESDGTLGGYVETRNGLVREIPKEMIIEIRLLNPFDNELPYSMTDAAKESQFTMKQAGDFTRHSIKGNINAPGIISTGVELDDHIFDNFVSRINNHTKGEPLYGNGTGVVDWKSMQIDMDKAGLDKINEINRAVLFSVSGVSKTSMGIEESGTGREVSKTQKDDFTENAVMPQIEDIIDALNLDYRKWYPEWETDKFEILLDNPLESDRDAELKDIEIRQTEHDMVVSLVNMGYEFDIAAKYAHGEIGLLELGEPTLEPKITPQEAAAQAAQQVGLPTPGNGNDGVDPNGQNPNPTDEDPNSPTGTGANNSVALNRLTEKEFVKPEENEKILKEAVAEAKKQKKELDSEDKKASKKPKVTEEPKTVAPEADKPKDDTIDTDLPDEEEPKDDKKNQPIVTVEVKTSQNDLPEKSINQIAARDYPDLYEGIFTPEQLNDLGCIMQDTQKIPVAQYIKNPDADIYTDGNHTGLAGENEAHVTLLFGLLENGNVWKDKVDTLLTGWSMPTVTIDQVSYFDLGESYAIIGLLEMTPELQDGHDRLTLLPHINTFSEYHPHITLAYINHDVDPQKWIRPLAKKYNGQKIATTALNYGDLPEEESDNILEAKQANANPQSTPTIHIHHDHDNEPNPVYEKAKNALQPDTKDQVILQESNLYGAVVNLQSSVIQAVIMAIRNGHVKEAEDIVTQAQEKRFKNELDATVAAFFTVLFPIYAQQLFASRAGEFQKQGVFAMTDAVKSYINQSAKKAADSHIDTILKDVEGAFVTAYTQSTEDSLVELVEAGVRAQRKDLLDKLPNNPNREDIVKAVKRGDFDANPIYKRAREIARQGKGLDAITRALHNEYQNVISKNRARTIARHETNRVFNMAQYQADVQFLTESGLMGDAYKKLYNRANDPCPVCAKLIEDTAQHPIPFQKNFVDLGTILEANYTRPNGKMAVQKIPINYEPIIAGNIHVNCRCEYELVIKQPDGTFLNDIDVRVANSKNYGVIINHVEDEHAPSVNKDFYDDLPGYVCVLMDNLYAEYKNESWFKEAWDTYRDHVLESDVDNMKMPGFVFGKYIKKQKKKNSLSYGLIKNAKSGNPNHDEVGRFSTGSSNPLSSRGGYGSLTVGRYDEKVEKDYSGQANWSNDEKHAIDSYTGADYTLINGALSHPKDKSYNHKYALESEKILNQAMKNSLVRDTTLYRGIGTSHDLTVGTTIVNKGFSSTSFNPSVAKEFAIHGVGFSETKRPVVLKINAEKGQKGILPYMSGATETRSNEQEYILPSNQTFKVTKVHDLGDYEVAEVSIV